MWVVGQCGGCGEYESGVVMKGRCKITIRCSQTKRLHRSSLAIGHLVSCPDPTLSRGKGSGDH